MRYRNIIIGLGFFVVIIQFLGFPQSWRNAFYAVSGILIVAGGYMSDKERKMHPAAATVSTSADSSGTLS
ncbi:MAG TPA: hypothetical protein VGE35_03320 [Candidatus Paceibacterota bacterium]